MTEDFVIARSSHPTFSFVGRIMLRQHQHQQRLHALRSIGVPPYGSAAAFMQLGAIHEYHLPAVASASSV